MKLAVHLVSMPWGTPFQPSIQLGALKAHLRNKLPNLDVCCHHAHFGIPFRMTKDFSSFSLGEAHEEYLYSLVVYQDFARAKLGAKSTVRTLLKAVNQSRLSTVAPRAVTRSDLSVLRTATIEFIDEEIVSRLSTDSVNLIGFTLNYHQVMASIFAMLHLLKRHGTYRYKFVLGGASVAVPSLVELLRKLGLPVLCCLGEGEAKLESMCRVILRAPEDGDEAALDRDIRATTPGVFGSLDAEPKNLWTRDVTDFRSQVNDIATLPVPDYDDYFRLVRQHCEDEETYERVVAMTRIPMEGTRGCFAKCAFCGLNASWEGFRKMSSEAVVERTLRMFELYRTRIFFTDNVCDTWAEGFARSLMERKLRVPAFMELRAHHPERFWTLLSLVGVDFVQVGIEAIAPNVLRAIGKGTRVIQNIAVQKYLTELQIGSASNLIVHHPGSTVEDARETRRVLELITHLQPFSVCRYLLTAGSPLFEKIPPAERPLLEHHRNVELPDDAAAMGQEFWYTPPAEWLPADVSRAWDEFFAWYNDHKKQSSQAQTQLTVTRMPGSRVFVRDTRRPGALKQVLLDLDASAVITQCHSPSSVQTIASETGISEERVGRALEELARQGFVLFADEKYLSLPIRPREELVANYYAMTSARMAPSVAPARAASIRATDSRPAPRRAALPML